MDAEDLLLHEDDQIEESVDANEADSVEAHGDIVHDVSFNSLNRMCENAPLSHGSRSNYDFDVVCKGVKLWATLHFFFYKHCNPAKTYWRLENNEK